MLPASICCPLSNKDHAHLVVAVVAHGLADGHCVVIAAVLLEQQVEAARHGKHALRTAFAAAHASNTDVRQGGCGSQEAEHPVVDLCQQALCSDSTPHTGASAETS